MIYNKVSLIGRLTHDPEMTVSQSGIAFVNFTLAVRQEYGRAKTNEENGAATADFIYCKAFGKTADLLNKYFFKGSMIAVDGQLRNDRYEKDGAVKYSQYVKITEIGFIESKKDSSASVSNPAPENSIYENTNSEEFTDEDLFDGVAF